MVGLQSLGQGAYFLVYAYLQRVQVFTDFVESGAGEDRALTFALSQTLFNGVVQLFTFFLQKLSALARSLVSKFSGNLGAFIGEGRLLLSFISFRHDIELSYLLHL